jgi:uncharacterized protein YeaO (DUF488 family)
MPFHFRTVQVGSPRQPNEGLRIGTVRFLPRGVPKAEYSERNLFDVWLPTIAPSRSLFRALKIRKIQPSAFFQRYRTEMGRTESRQVIQLLAEMARATPISVACYCAQEAKCHRSVLRELIREAAGEPAERPLAADCVYTIAHPDELQRIAEADRGAGDLVERKRWTSALSLWHEAQSRGEVLPLVFADATDCSRLIYWAKLNAINLSDEGTQYFFSGLRRIGGGRTPQELTLQNTGSKIAVGFIRPYALVHTPKFLR